MQNKIRCNKYTNNAMTQNLPTMSIKALILLLDVWFVVRLQPHEADSHGTPLYTGLSGTSPFPSCWTSWALPAADQARPPSQAQWTPLLTKAAPDNSETFPLLKIILLWHLWIMYESPETNKPNRESLIHFSRKKSPWEEKSLNHLSVFQKFALQKIIYNYQQSHIYIFIFILLLDFYTGEIVGLRHGGAGPRAWPKGHFRTFSMFNSSPIHCK